MLRAADSYDQARRELDAARRALVRSGRAAAPKAGGAANYTLEHWALQCVTSILFDGVGTDEDPGGLLRADAMPGGLERSLRQAIDEDRRRRRAQQPAA
jgi:hypothetical protein